MKNILTILFVFCLYAASANNYYFSAVSGNDSRTASQAQNASTPWKTIGKLNDYFKHLQPGDSVLFKRGETFYGSIVVNKSGKAGSPIVIGAFDTGKRPVITGLTTLAKWVAMGGGIYECFNPAFGSSLNVVLINDAAQPMGRYPNKGYLTIDSHSGKKSITDNNLSAAPGWKGAELVIRSSHWVINRFLIKSHSRNTLHYSGTAEPRNRFGYFIQNSIKTLDQQGEWYYNSYSKKISMYFGSGSPKSYNITAGSVNSLIYSSGKSYVVFDNLTLKGANRYGVNVNKGNRFIFKNCDILFSGIDGVKVSRHLYFTFENSNVLNSYNNGINAVSNDNAIIKNNIVRNTYYVAGMGQSGDAQGAGIRIGRSGLAQNNQVIKSGYIGIQFGGDYSVVKNNYIDSFCFVKDDGGAIYTYNGRANKTLKGRKVTGNIVLNGIGAPEGTDITISDAEGIYMDDNTNGVEITGNTVANCHRGFLFHNSRRITANNNTLFNNVEGQLYMKHDGLGDALRKHTITNNIFFAKLSTQLASSINTKDNDIGSIGRIDSNYYARPVDNTRLISTTIYIYTKKQVRRWHDLTEWISKYKKDYSSKLFLKTIDSDPDHHIKFVYNPGMVSKTVSLDGNYIDAKNNRFSNSIVLQPYTSAVLIKDGATQKAAPAVNITSPSVNANYKTSATISVSANATDADGSVKKVDFYIGTTLLHTETGAPYIFSWKKVPAGNYTLTAKATDNDGNETTSEKVLISVSSSNTENNTAPEVNITSPKANTVYRASATVNITASASDADGSIRRVDFYNGTKFLHSEWARPYNCSWRNVPAGNYTITAKAIDNKGNVSASESVSISVAAPSSQGGNKSPQINITSPEVNSVYTEKATITVTADANDADGTIKKVEFYNGGALLDIERKAPYIFAWRKVRAGNYVITAKATDNSGNVTTSRSVSVSVRAKKASNRASKNDDTSRVINNGASGLSNVHDISLKQQEAESKTQPSIYTLKVFPNPAVNKIQIKVEGLQMINQGANLSIQTLSGIIIKNIPVILSGKAIEADVTSLKTGMYVVSIATDNFITSSKFIKN